jgi:hypothetical protein
VNRKTLARTMILVGGAAALLLATGCTGVRNPVARDTLIRNNPTPELNTLDMRDVDRDNRRAIARNENWRMLREDWDRMWYVNRASRLTSYPMR